MCIRQARLEPLALSASSRERYPTQRAANTSCPRSGCFWLLELRVSQHFSTFYGPSVQAVDTQLNALPTLPVLARTVSGCLNSAFLGRRSSRGRRGGELAVRCMPWPITRQSRVISSREHSASRSRPAAFPTLLLLPGFQGRRAEDPRAASACGKESQPSLRLPRVPRPAPLVRVGAVVAGRGGMN